MRDTTITAMRVRGSRECQDCGREWSYYETGTITCPACGSLRSVGRDEPTEHTAGQPRFDLTEARDALERGRPLREALDAAGESCRQYLREHGFVDAGELRPLTDRDLAAMELRHAADIVGRSFTPTEVEELYVLSLLSGADTGTRPDADAVPDSLRTARGLAAAEAVDRYRRAIRRTGDDRPTGRREVLAALDERVRRVRALEGEVPPREADRLVRIVQAVTEDELDHARVLLDGLP